MCLLYHHGELDLSTPEEDFSKKSKHRLSFSNIIWLLEWENFDIVIIISAENDWIVNQQSHSKIKNLRQYS